ncbi:hypothetical protein TTHERM_000852969 (macronuclear) [Tetrahymena thermophila SB210]|uniref:Uncharacterized protein n=1 Tax=Tetrahymena thermophila (strain SB210) TaxID=312017 RepID=W7XCB1_TETTS|nr:hypothetical protein TTHERM_000852969 [Tetrahymena thermophila SB210]EWS71371.1 hypothetical protein TTHERM_000852969 [Tetrahymena thermophila SB210]|eukprot:XP_012656104.1 hypothetical protein TTHERM_000852969 [Tetrahymena thermophila SB210]
MEQYSILIYSKKGSQNGNVITFTRCIKIKLEKYKVYSRLFRQKLQFTRYLQKKYNLVTLFYILHESYVPSYIHRQIHTYKKTNKKHNTGQIYHQKIIIDTTNKKFKMNKLTFCGNNIIIQKATLTNIKNIGIELVGWAIFQLFTLVQMVKKIVLFLVFQNFQLQQYIYCVQKKFIMMKQSDKAHFTFQNQFLYKGMSYQSRKFSIQRQK